MLPRSLKDDAPWESNRFLPEGRKVMATLSLIREDGPGNLPLGLRATISGVRGMSREGDKGRRRKSFHLKLVEWLVTPSQKPDSLDRYEP